MRLDIQLIFVYKIRSTLATLILRTQLKCNMHERMYCTCAVWVSVIARMLAHCLTKNAPHMHTAHV